MYGGEKTKSAGLVAVCALLRSDRTGLVNPDARLRTEYTGAVRWTFLNRRLG